MQSDHKLVLYGIMALIPPLVGKICAENLYFPSCYIYMYELIHVHVELVHILTNILIIVIIYSVVMAAAGVVNGTRVTAFDVGSFLNSCRW